MNEPVICGICEKPIHSVASYGVLTSKSFPDAVHVKCWTREPKDDEIANRIKFGPLQLTRPETPDILGISGLYALFTILFFAVFSLIEGVNFLFGSSLFLLFVGMSIVGYAILFLILILFKDRAKQIIQKWDSIEERIKANEDS